MNLGPEELVKALNEYAVLVQQNSCSNIKALAYNAKVEYVLGEPVIVIETFR